MSEVIKEKGQKQQGKASDSRGPQVMTQWMQETCALTFMPLQVATQHAHPTHIQNNQTKEQHRGKDVQYVRVTKDTLDMMQEVIANYQAKIRFVVEQIGINAQQISEEAKKRWDIVASTESHQAKLGKLQRRLAEGQRDEASLTAECLKVEAQLESKKGENETTFEMLEQMSKSLSITSVNLQKSIGDKRGLLVKIRQESEDELQASTSIHASRDAKIEAALVLCQENVRELESELDRLQSKSDYIRGGTAQLSRECEDVEQTLLALNKDLKDLRDAQRLEDSMLESELSLGLWSDSEISMKTKALIEKITKEKSEKDKLTEDLLVMQESLAKKNVFLKKLDEQERNTKETDKDMNYPSPSSNEERRTTPAYTPCTPPEKTIDQMPSTPKKRNPQKKSRVIDIG